MRRTPTVRRRPSGRHGLLAFVGGGSVGVLVYLVQYGVGRAFERFRDVGAMERIGAATDLYGGLTTVLPLTVVALGAGVALALWRGRGLAAFAVGAGAAAVILDEPLAGGAALVVGGVLLCTSLVWTRLFG